MLADLAMTALMNSRVSGDDLVRAETWMKADPNAASLSRVAKLLTESEGLHDATDPTIAALGDVMNSIQTIKGIKTAKVAKWFAAWAPCHVPMIDQWVRMALTGKTSVPSTLDWRQLLVRYRDLLRPNIGTLQQLGERLSHATGLPQAVSPVRVLDSLLWFDWWAAEQYQSDFGQWITAEETADGYRLTTLGEQFDALSPRPLPAIASNVASDPSTVILP